MRDGILDMHTLCILHVNMSLFEFSLFFGLVFFLLYVIGTADAETRRGEGGGQRVAYNKKLRLESNLFHKLAFCKLMKIMFSCLQC